MHDEKIMVFFTCDHLPEHLQEISKPFCDLAVEICARLDIGAQRTAALQKLLEAKDAAVRARVQPGC